jgi:protocatechuate 3,4-dioxygenase beta subunit
VIRRIDELVEGHQHCRVWPDQEEGPYHRDVALFRQDVVEDRAGIALRLAIRLVGGDGLTPVRGAVVELWQCDALGQYSGFPPPDGRSDTGLADEAFLRGRQETDESGICRFRTVYPGWYPGRTVHIHVMAHVGGETFTSQLYFPEEITEAVFARPPYSERPGRDTANSSDTIFASGGEDAVLDLEEDGEGYRAAICFLLPAVVH